MSTQANWLNDAVQIGATGEYKFVPANIALEKSYKIWIFVWTQGGTSDAWNVHDDVGITPTFYYLHVGCPTSSMT